MAPVTPPLPNRFACRVDHCGNVATINKAMGISCPHFLKFYVVLAIVGISQFTLLAGVDNIDENASSF
jgi:hypothetical protein